MVALWEFIRVFSEAVISEEVVGLAAVGTSRNAFVSILEMSVDGGLDVGTLTVGDVVTLVDAMWTVNGCDKVGKLLGLYSRTIQERMQPQPTPPLTS